MILSKNTVLNLNTLRVKIQNHQRLKSQGKLKRFLLKDIMKVKLLFQNKNNQKSKDIISKRKVNRIMLSNTKTKNLVLLNSNNQNQVQISNLKMILTDNISNQWSILSKFVKIKDLKNNLIRNIIKILGIIKTQNLKSQKMLDNNTNNFLKNKSRFKSKLQGNLEMLKHLNNN